MRCCFVLFLYALVGDNVKFSNLCCGYYNFTQIVISEYLSIFDLALSGMKGLKPLSQTKSCQVQAFCLSKRNIEWSQWKEKIASREESSFKLFPYTVVFFFHHVDSFFYTSKRISSLTSLACF